MDQATHQTADQSVDQTIDRWYEDSFGEDYLLVYRHRSREEAAREIRGMLAWLPLPEAGHILDLCCGTGRHALALAEAGFRVTGVDLSPVLLREARASDSEGRVRWIRSDMRALSSLEEQFDAVINLFTSFGYFEEDAEQLEVLLQIRQSLQPGGLFVIDYLNAGYTADRLVPYSEREADGAVIQETRRVENRFIVKEIVVRDANRPNRPPRRYVERVKLYTLERMSELLREAGLALEAVYGGYEGEAYDAFHSRRMILVGSRGSAPGEQRNRVFFNSTNSNNYE